MTICLSMIVKNEASCISKCLESLKKYIDYWIICDTGSTDNTEEVVKNILNNIPGEYHHHEWKDFSTNRNLALQLSKNKADYTLIIDADDYLSVYDENAFNNLKELVYTIEIQHGTIKYNRIQLVHASIPCRYVGVLHEYLDVFGAIPKQLSGVVMHFGGVGARSRDPEKFKKDAEIFEKALLTEPYNSRYVFYCAQSYRDSGNLEKALEYYIKRSSMGGWQEEIYISLLESSKIIERIKPNDFEAIENSYLHTYNYLPSRSESLFYLSSFCRKRGAFDKSYFYGKVGNLIRLPNDGLFLEPACYDWKIKDEIAVSAYYIKKYEESFLINEELLNNPNIPFADKERIKNNLEFCKIKK